MPKIVNLLIIGLFYSTFSLGQDQKSQEKDPSENEEVFFISAITNAKEANWSNLDSTIKALNEAIVYFKENNSNCNLSYAEAVKGRAYYNYGMADSATASYISASQHANLNCPDSILYYFYNSWAILYLEMGDFELGDSISLLALKATQSIEDKEYELNVLTNRALLYSQNGNNDTAILISKNIYIEAVSINNSYHIWSSLQNTGHFFIRSGENDSALFYFNKMQSLVSEEMPAYLQMHLYNNLAVVYSKKGEIKKGADYYYRAIELAYELGKLNSLLIYLDNYSAALNKLERYQESRVFLQYYVDLKDSLESADKVQFIKTLEKNYEIGKQREKILLLEQEDLKKDLELERGERDRDIVIAVLIGVFLLSIGLYTRLRFTRKSKNIIENEKKRSDDLLLNILPAQVAEELKQKGESEARQYNDVSVLFTDFVKFTQFTQKLTAKELVEEIGYCFKSFDEICTSFGIEKIKTIGDAYMAAAGVPSSDAKAAENSIRAVLEMQEFMIKRFAEKTESGQPGLQMRSGIHSGPVVAGIVGVKKFQYDIWGDTVNTAARMESSGVAEKVNISVVTYNYVKNIPDFKFESRGKIEVKGKGLIEMYYVSLATTKN